jgi:hypothetical protein
MAKYLGYVVLNEPFLAVYADPKTTIKKIPVYGFLLVSGKEGGFSLLPMVYDEESCKLYAEGGESEYFLGVFPQSRMDAELEARLKEEAKNVLPPPLEYPHFFFRREKIMKIIEEAEKQYPNGEVPKEELVARAVRELGMEGKEPIIEKDIRSLYESGRIYIPRPGYVKIVPRRDY